MLLRAGKVLLLATVSVVLGGVVILIVDRIHPQDSFNSGVAIAAALWFVMLLLVLTGGPGKNAEPPTRFPHDEEPLVGCPICHSPMHLLGTNGRPGFTRLYLWACERDHGWSRQGENPADTTYPWQPCNAAEMVGVFFG